jgi:hypothetical protein
MRGQNFSRQKIREEDSNSNTLVFSHHFLSDEEEQKSFQIPARKRRCELHKSFSKDHRRPKFTRRKSFKQKRKHRSPSNGDSHLSDSLYMHKYKDTNLRINEEIEVVDVSGY